ncbi:class I SAM-dependent DNA methyltransferase [Halalkalibacter krulwichiae]|uniref:dTDP-3-amino-3,4, 6-trideoxy-alpha-D-glucopyranose n=1 Tax=Halalkalibacter krulwichiae TaxID=199441 RepID=A0A1X9M7A1_9BACI|nr:class I SAM-dependent methyltransferase [Halalkalibacter krulwichiae]ARK29296.1 dTDP-3-amino-3,4,6-trideoxy-alpha-D-glucopyranose [Halalkalibacter krulwichiae]
MNYQAFAALYDSLMTDAPYDKWIAYLQRNVKQDLKGVSIYDVGCGTGEFLVRLHNSGAIVSGVDLSADMLSLAQKKCEQAGFSPPLYQQSMTELESVMKFEIVTIFCDSLNYLETEKDVLETFKHVHQLLEEGGVFIFDVHSISKINDGFIGQTFAEDAENMAYIWNSFQGEHPNSVEHEMTFFLEEEEIGMFQRFFELHKQRTYSIDQYREWLHDAGFSNIVVNADFEDVEPTDESERIFFCAKKR